MCHSGKLIILTLLATIVSRNAGFQLVMMGARRGKGIGLKRSLDSTTVGDKKSTQGNAAKALNQGRGQEITGVTLPANGKAKGWEFGNKSRIVCANVNGQFYALEGQCPRCAFDLWKGDLLVEDPGWDDLPRIACPTCSTTYALVTGKKGPPLKRTGLAGFVGNLAKTATVDASSKDAKAYIITRDDDGRVYCRER